MWIRNFDLEDFGCFRRARLLELEDGLTVISGPQRAGKTTFMQAMRKLGYGINSGDNIPPPNEEYHLAADIVHDGSKCDISVKGHADPRVFSSGGLIESGELFGSVTADQYRQLFTISLNQLRQKPPEIDERRELSAILLGAGYGDIAHIPEIKSNLSGKAREIGGKHGRAVYEMKGPIETIENGIGARENAKAHVDDHREAKSKLREIKSQIDEVDAAEQSHKLKRARFTAIEAHYDEFDEYRRLDQELLEMDTGRIGDFPLAELDRAQKLAEKYRDTIADWDEGLGAFRRRTDVDNIEAHQEALLDLKVELEQFDQEISGWRKEIETLEDRDRALRETHADLERRAASINQDWSDDSEQALEIPLDSITEDSVRQIAENYTSVEVKLDDANSKLKQLRTRLEETKSSLDEATDDSGESLETRRTVARIAGVTFLGLLSGVAIGLGYDPILGLGTTVVIVAIATIYAYVKLGVAGGLAGDSPVSQLKAEKHRLKSDIKTTEEQIVDLKAELDRTEDALDELRNTLGLPDHVSAEGVQSYYRDVDELQGDINKVNNEESILANLRTKLETRLLDVKSTVDPVIQIDGIEEDPLHHAEDLFTTIRTASEELELAQDLDEIQGKLADIREDSADILAGWEGSDVEDWSSKDASTVLSALEEFTREGEEIAELAEAVERHSELESRLLNYVDRRAVREAFLPVIEETRGGKVVDQATDELEVEQVLTAFEQVTDQFVDQRAVRDGLDQIDAELADLEEQRNKLVDTRADLRKELESFASDEDLIAAQETIERGRQQLVPLAERYATLRIAEHLIDELHERFIERATGPLLEDASELFEHITDEYTDLQHAGTLDRLDFKAVRDDGIVQLSNELSRATAEQLFLAVRIARIQQLDVSLPVVLDDSMTNFDPKHLSRTLDLVEELAKTNQIFFMTCHPSFVEEAAEKATVSQFWTLEDGVFKGPYSSPEPLVSVLS